MINRRGSRAYRPFSVKCEVRERQKLVNRTFAYRAHAEKEVRKKVLTKLSVVRVLEITEITEEAYDKLIKSKRYPNGLPSHK